MAEDNQTSMTREERWAEIQKWVAWVDAQRLLGGTKPAGLIDAYLSDPRSDEAILHEWLAHPQEPTGAVHHIMWRYPEYTQEILTEEAK